MLATYFLIQLLLKYPNLNFIGFKNYYIWPELLKNYNMNLSIVLGILGAPEIVLIVLGMVLLFGGKKIPELMKGIGQGIKEFKKASKNEDPIADEKKDTEKLQNPQV